MTRASNIKAEEIFPISEQGYTVGKLVGGTECQILLITGASKSFMSKSHYFAMKINVIFSLNIFMTEKYSAPSGD